MSMSLLVILELANAPTTSALERAAAEIELPAIEYQVSGPLYGRSGYVAIILDGKETGYEMYSLEYARLKTKGLPLDATVFVNPAVFQFVGRGTAIENAAILYTATVMVQEFDAVAIDTDTARSLSAKELSDAARELLRIDTQ